MSWTATIIFRLKKVYLKAKTLFLSKLLMMPVVAKIIIQKKSFRRGGKSKQDFVSWTATIIFRLKKVWLIHIELLINIQIQPRPTREENHLAEINKVYCTWIWSFWSLLWERQILWRIWLQTEGFQLERFRQALLAFQKTFKMFI